MNIRISRALKLGLTRRDASVFAKLKTPAQIQDYVSALPTNFEVDGDSCLSVAQVLRQKKAHCIEGAFIAACALWINGQKPLLMDMQARAGDDDHVVTLFRDGRHWGAISKTNHIWLRWRDPVYRTPRELAMSYFHEYVDTRQRKSLRTYSMPIDLRRFAPETWITNDEDCWDVGAALCDVRHFKLLTAAQVRALAPRDATETLADDMVQYEYKDRMRARRY
jgi:hypothetical protein